MDIRMPIVPLPKRPNIETRERLARLHWDLSGPFGVAEAGRVLGLDPVRARRFVIHLAANGWLNRIRPGLYTTAAIGSGDPASQPADPWVVAARAFSPCYIAGWSACAHWGLIDQTDGPAEGGVAAETPAIRLSDQVFKDVAVVTARTIRQNPVTIQGTAFHLRHRPKRGLFGTRLVLRGGVEVPVSDPTKTLIDILDAPPLGAGIRHVAGVVERYFAGEHRDEDLLLNYAVHTPNGSLFKRLGYLLERLRIDAPATDLLCRGTQSTGLTFLDPGAPRTGRISKRWNLRVNVACG